MKLTDGYKNKGKIDPLIYNAQIFCSRPWAIDYYSTLTTENYLNKKHQRSASEHFDFAHPAQGKRNFMFEYKTRPEVRFERSKEDIYRPKIISQKTVQTLKPSNDELRANYTHHFVYENNTFKESKFKSENCRMSPYARKKERGTHRNTSAAATQMCAGDSAWESQARPGKKGLFEKSPEFIAAQVFIVATLKK